MLNTDPRLNLLHPPPLPPNRLQFSPLQPLLLLLSHNLQLITLQPRLLCLKLRPRLRMLGAMLKAHASALSTKAFSRIINRVIHNEVEGHSRLLVHVAVVSAAATG